MNKIGSVAGILIFIIALIITIAITIPIAYNEGGLTCSFRSNSILSSVNSLEDIDTGLFSSGTIREKTLLFSDGLVVTLKSYQTMDLELVLGNKYRVNKCSTRGGRISYEVREFALGEKDDE